MADEDKTEADTKAPEQAPDNFTVTTSDTPEPAPEPKPADQEPDKKPEAAKEGEPDTKPAEVQEPDKKPADDPDAKAKADAAEAERKAWDDVPEGVRKRIARQSRRQRELEAELDELKATKAAPAAEVEAEDDDPEELDPDDFDSFDEFKAAEEKQKAEAEKLQAEPKEPTPDAAAAFKAQHGMELSDFNEAQGKLQEAVETDDPTLWEEAATADKLKVSAHLVASLAETADPAAVLRQLVDDPALSEKISAMTPVQQARELVKLETPGAAPAGDDEPKVTPARLSTKAGEPIEPGGTGGRGVTKSLEDMDQAEFEAHRNAQEAARSVKGGW